MKEQMNEYEIHVRYKKEQDEVPDLKDYTV